MFSNYSQLDEIEHFIVDHVLDPVKVSKKKKVVEEVGAEVPVQVEVEEEIVGYFDSDSDSGSDSDSDVDVEDVGCGCSKAAAPQEVSSIIDDVVEQVASSELQVDAVDDFVDTISGLPKNVRMYFENLSV